MGISWRQLSSHLIITTTMAQLLRIIENIGHIWTEQFCTIHGIFVFKTELLNFIEILFWGSAFICFQLLGFMDNIFLILEHNGDLLLLFCQILIFILSLIFRSIHFIFNHHDSIIFFVLTWCFWLLFKINLWIHFYHFVFQMFYFLILDF